jgi:N-acetylneuraminic acid mutarotase
MIVWGGVNATRVWGGAYDPAADQWRRIPNGPLPNRHSQEAVWTGDRMIVWGGRTQIGLPATDLEGAEYDPATRTWKTMPLSPIGAPTAAASLWTGDEMVITGGFGTETATRAGAAYDPVARTWRAIAEVPVARERGGAPIPLTDSHTTPVWTGKRAVFVTADGVFSYDPRADRWQRVNAPREAWRWGATVAWTGDELLVWSGSQWDAEGYLTSGWSARD